MENEEWVPVKGFEDSYMISNHGRVRSIDRMEWRNSKMESKRIRRERDIKLGMDKYGYLKVNLSRHKITSYKTIHRLVAEHFLDNPDNLPEVNHKFRPKTNNRADNLEWCTGEYNRKHQVDNGLIQKSDETAYNAKLKNIEVIEIRKRYDAGGVSAYALAQEYGVGRSTILRAIHRKTFKAI